MRRHRPWVTLTNGCIVGIGRPGRNPSRSALKLGDRFPALNRNRGIGERRVFVRFEEDLTARLTLLFAVVNLSLARIKLRGDPPPEGAFLASTWVPWAGCATCIALLVAELALETNL
jgi:hypothetical protein